MKNFKLTALILAGFVLIAISCQKKINTETPTNKITDEQMVEWIKSQFPDYDFDQPKSVNERTVDCMPEPQGCLPLGNLTFPINVGDCELDVTMDIEWCTQDNTAFFTEVLVSYEPGSTCELDESVVQQAYNDYVEKFMASLVWDQNVDFDCGSGSFVTSNYTHMTCTMACLADNDGRWEWQYLPCSSEQACCESIKTWCKDGEDTVVESETTTLEGQCSGFFNPFGMGCNDQFSRCGVRECE